MFNFSTNLIGAKFNFRQTLIYICQLEDFRNKSRESSNKLALTNIKPASS